MKSKLICKLSKCVSRIKLEKLALVVLISLVIPIVGCQNKSEPNVKAPENTLNQNDDKSKNDYSSKPYSHETMSNICNSKGASDMADGWGDKPLFIFFDKFFLKTPGKFSFDKCFRKNKIRGNTIISKGKNCELLYDGGYVNINFVFPKKVIAEEVSEKYGDLILFKDGFQPDFRIINDDGEVINKNWRFIRAVCLSVDGGYLAFTKGENVMWRITTD